uniref:2-iminobutanoate/2-iminopropanoate deaminase n=1 Tax=Podarcis muralis TaxID=64176 RepID=A0A670KDT3_PODMU
MLSMLSEEVCIQAVLVDRTMYIAGQLGLDPSNGQFVPGGTKEQAKQALHNIGEILKAAGCDYDNVVKTTVLMADMKDFDDVNEIYKVFRFSMRFARRIPYGLASQNESLASLAIFFAPPPFSKPLIAF